MNIVLPLIADRFALKTMSIRLKDDGCLNDFRSWHADFLEDFDSIPN